MIHRFSDREQEALDERPRRTFVGTLFHRRVPILIGLGILLIAAITLIVVLPRQFQSQLDILVRNKLPLSARVKATEQETVDEQRMQSELALLHSPDLAVRVVEPDYPTQPDTTHTAADIKRHQAAVALFSQQLVTTVAPNSNLIHVVVTAEDPHRAGELASRLLEVFFASQSEVGHPTPATAFFIAEANRARAAWQEAQLSLDGFRLAHPTSPTGNAADITLQIAALNHQIQRNDEQIDAAIGRILTGERKLITIPAHPLDPGRKSRNANSSMPELSVAQLNAMLAIYNDEQAILLTRPPTDSEAVRASLSLAGQIADTNAARQFAEQTAAAGHDPAPNSLWQSTTDEIAQASSELKSLYLTRTGLANQLSGFQASLDRIEHPSTILAGFQNRTTTLQNAFRLADQRANEARIADAMDQQLRLNVAVASRPSFSNTATSPSPWLYGTAIALAVIFLAACLTLFAGMYSNEVETDELEDYDDYEDSSDARNAHGYVPDSSEGTQQQIPFPSRIRSSQSGAFLYAAPGGSVPPPRPVPEATGVDPAFEPIPQPFVPVQPEAVHSVEADQQPIVEEAQAEDASPEPESHPSPAAEILPPHQYASGEPLPEEPADPPSSFASASPFARQASGETHAAVPSFFAAPPSASLTTEPEEDHDLAHEEGPPYPFFESRFQESPAPNLNPDAAAPFPYAAKPAAVSPEPLVDEPAPIFSAIPTPEPEPIVTTPDPTPPWSQPAAAEPKPTPIPPLSYWAAVYDTTPPDPEPAVTSSVAPQHPAADVTPEPEPLVEQIPTYVAPELVAAAPEPSSQPISPPVTPKALPQAFTSTARPFLTTFTSTLSVPAFRYAAPPVAPPPVQQANPPAPPAPPRQVAPEPTALAPDPELILSYASSEPIELVPDPVLPPVKPPYKVAPSQTTEPISVPEPARLLPPEFSEFPVYRAPKPLQVKETPSEPAPDAARPQTYEEMVRALVFPEESAPYVPPARPTPAVVPDVPVVPVAAAPRRAEALPEPLPPAPSSDDPLDDEAPPFHYARRSAPMPPPEQAFAPTPQVEDHEALQNFIRRPSAPLQPPPEAPYRDDRTTYRAAQPPAPAQPAEALRSSWIDIAPPPIPRGEETDPHKRPPDRISAIRDQSSVRSSIRANLVDESGNRLTPSQRMKRGRPVPTYDKDGKVSYVDYLNDQDKTRY